MNSSLYDAILSNIENDKRQLERCLSRIEPLIDAREDDLRVYPLPAHGYKARLGRACLPDGVQWSALPAPW